MLLGSKPQIPKRHANLGINPILRNSTKTRNPLRLNSLSPIEPDCQSGSSPILRFTTETHKIHRISNLGAIQPDCQSGIDPRVLTVSRPCVRDPRPRCSDHRDKPRPIPTISRCSIGPSSPP